jgi:hypothetical protein
VTTGPGQDEATRGWYRRFVERLDPGDRVGELLFGLIMVLTFTLGAGIELDAGDRNATGEVLVAALGCNTAWGVIDAVLHLISRLSERGRLYRLVKAIQETPSSEQAQALVAAEMQTRLPAAVQAEMRERLHRHVVERVREMKLERNRLTAPDLWAALAVFWLVFLTALPPLLPFLVMRDERIAMRASNAILIGLLFYVGWRWAGFIGASPLRTALSVSLIGVALVVVAIALGG